MHCDEIHKRSERLASSVKRVQINARQQAFTCAALLMSFAFSFGCANSPTLNNADAFGDMSAVLKRADIAAAGGEADKALALLESAARSNPASSKPWLKMAQISFDRGDYPTAIRTAEEASQRDQSSLESKSISLVACLRLAVRNIQALRGGAGMSGDARTEAEKLALTLRESIKEQVLVPVGGDDPKRPSRNSRSSSRQPVRQPGAQDADVPATPAVKTPPQRSSSDPFGTLK